jgi:hypothetical protein
MSVRPNLLSTTRLALRVLIALNIPFAIGVAGLFAVSLEAPIWLGKALVARADAAPSLMTGMRLVMLIGLAGVPLAYLFLTRLLAMVDSVRDGDPFIAENARRLQMIAWAMLGIQGLNLAEGAVCALFPLDFDWSPSVDGWLAVLLLFVLARVFDIGIRMRADLDGTV